MDRLARLSLAHPHMTIGVVVAVSLFFGSGLFNLRNQTGYRTFLGEDHPELVKFDRFVERFGGGYPILIAFSCDDTPECEDVFDPIPLAMTYELSRRFQEFGAVSEVLSPATTSLLVPLGDQGFEPRTLYEGGRPVEDLEALAELARQDPLWNGSVIGEEGRVGAIIIQLVSTDTASQDLVAKEAYEALAPFEKEHGFEFRMVGKSVEFVIANIFVNDHTGKVTPVMVVLLSAVLYSLFRSVIATVLCLVTMGVPALWSQGLMGLLDIPLDAVTSNAAMIVFVIGVCDAVHFLSRYCEEARFSRPATREERRNALIRVAEEIGGACFLTTATTTVAMLSFLYVGYSSFVGFAISTAAGITGALLLTFSLLPVMMFYIGVGWARERTSESWVGFSNWLAESVSAYSGPILVITALSTIVCGYGLSRIYVEIDDEELQGRDNPVTHWSYWVEEHLRAPKSIELHLTLPEDRSFETTEALEAVEALEAHLSSIPPLGPSHSVLEVVREVHHHLSGEIGLPTSDDAIAESLLFVPGDLMSQWLSLNRRHVRVSTEAPTLSTTEAEEVLSNVIHYLDTRLPSGWRYEMTGTVPMAYEVAHGILDAQFRTFALAFTLVLICLWISFRSLPLAIFGMVPNILPIVVIPGALGLWGVPFDFAMTMVASVLIGIAVDDTIHLLFQYRERVRVGDDSMAAVRHSLIHIGRSVVTSSIAIAMGFLGLAVASSMSTFSNLSYLTAFAIMGALVADLVVLPALVFLCSSWLDMSFEGVPQPERGQ